ncbi:YheC/YheD family protein [Paenibacillus sp. PAMC21692]|uniref:YheC/YheD family protein n=1 Tax=Paenibacillus sp. PAMC21692 TaxID=2762320 RepID=UPI00164EB454|nr:YheC/YheD family protein [Paenibacillus sp. PAMC21692]QNK56213.1 YheC/YheD family protein [Paenibacillus sp. PAMC21692]
MSVKRYASRRIRGKLKVCRYLENNGATRRMVPDTESYSLANMRKLAKRYNSLYIKPDVGSLGIGISKLSRQNGGYLLKESWNKSQRSRSLGTLEAAYRHLKAKGRGKLIVQQAIKLDKVDGKPYDIRAMVQRKPGGAWTCTGFIVKVGGKGKIVTNYYQGGAVWKLRKLHRRLGLNAQESNYREEQLRSEAITIAKTLSARQSGMREMGIDFARDRGGKLWILEVNSNHPQFHPLKAIDRTAYDRMKEYAASYGRYDAK